jgi:MFS transporter, putative metabolite:H+ symporter
MSTRQLSDMAGTCLAEGEYSAMVTMKLRGRRRASDFRHAGFLIGTILVVTGVLLHLPDYISSRSMHFVMAGMAMGGPMAIGMTLIVIGLAIAIWGLLPDRATRRRVVAVTGGNAAAIAALDDLKMSPAHWKLIAALSIGLVVDTMKPATLGFVVPAMATEYHIGLKTAALLPFVAITGTVIGSLVWGRLADVYGRRATILISGLMYVATCICGFMPTFDWNLVMCFLMGAAAGGMLPTVYSLASESIPARHRGWVLVAMSGIGAMGGYLVASGAATVIEPVLTWRALWVLNAPTGLLLLAFSWYIPESPRFLLATGHREKAAEVMARFGMTYKHPTATEAVAPAKGHPRPLRGGLWILASAAYYRRSLVVVLYGLGWSIVNWGFITFLPAYMGRANMGTHANNLLFLASVLSLPAIGLASILYVRIGGKLAMIVYAIIVALVLAAFVVTNPARPGHTVMFVTLTALLLTSSNGMLAMLSPYATELYPTGLRASGSGLAAAATKVGGMSGLLLVSHAPGVSALALWAFFPMIIAVVTLWGLGPRVKGSTLTDTIIAAGKPEPETV